MGSTWPLGQGPMSQVGSRRLSCRSSQNKPHAVTLTGVSFDLKITFDPLMLTDGPALPIFGDMPTN